MSRADRILALAIERGPLGVTHSAVQRALVDTANAHALVPFDIRLLVALHERGGSGTSDEIQAEMFTEGTPIRRSSLDLRRRGLILADAGPGTRTPKRGTRSRYTLTANGSQIAMQALRAAGRLIPGESDRMEAVA